MTIFLDIDGVMVSAKGWKTPDIAADGFYEFLPTAVKALKTLIQKDTIVILTTSHRSAYSIEEWQDIFKSREIEINNLYKIDSVGDFSRKDLILHWLTKNPLIDYLIIDDDTSLNDLPKNMKDHLILTRPIIGLTLEDIKNNQNENA